LASSSRINEVSNLKNLPAGRKATITAYVYEHGEVTVSELAEFLGVSVDTIRRDLHELNSENFLIRTHGGAISPKIVPKLDSNLDIRLGLEVARKVAIGKAAASLIKDNSVILLNSGTTILALVKELKNHSGLTIATNNLHITKELNMSSVRALHIIGGTVLFSSQATLGPVSLMTSGGDELEIQCDLTMIAVGGVSADGGYSVTNLGEASMFKDMMAHGNKIAILADASKFGMKLFAKLGDLSQADYFVTDVEPPADLKLALEKARVQIVLPPKV
jgi:DeoR/GlpR family transcriptional regulator of sugar metabolism